MPRHYFRGKRLNLLRVLRFLQEADRRLLYGLLLLVVAGPFLLRPHLGVQVSPQTQQMFDAIDSLPPRSFVYFGTDWAAGTRGENLPQTTAVMRHLMKKKLRFAIISLDPQGKQLAQRVAERLQGRYGYREGVDWVNWGYQVAGTDTDEQNYIKGFTKDVPGYFKTDIHGQPLATLPVMQGIRTASDINFIVSITPTNSYRPYIAFLAQSNKIPMGLCPTAVMAPEAFVYLDSRQLVGLVNGVQGAAEYEQLLRERLPEDLSDAKGIEKASEFLPSLSFAHLLIIVFILLGNVAMILERRQRAALGGGGR